MIEKIRPKDRLIDVFYTDQYHAFKRKNGYSESEIINKAKSLNNVLIPWDLEENLELLRCGGFKKVDIFFKWYNFVGMLGVK